MTSLASSPDRPTRLAFRAGDVVRVLGYAVAIGAAGALLPGVTCAAVAGALVAFEVACFGGRRAPAPAAMLVALAAALAAPLLATATTRALVLGVGAVAWVALAWARPLVALAALIAIAPFHTLVLSVLEGRWLLEGGALGQWKDLGIATLGVRALAMAVRREGRSAACADPRAWARPVRWGVALTAWVAATSVRALVVHQVGLGLALRGLAADLGPLALVGIAARVAGDDPAEARRLRALTVWLAALLAVFGLVQLAILGPGWYAAAGYTGPRDFKVPGYEHYRLTSVFLDPLPAGLVFAIASLLALDDAFRAGVAGARVRSLALAAGLAVTALATFTRSAWLGLALGAAIVARVHWRDRAARRWIALAVLATAAATLPLAPRLASWTRDTLTGAATDTSSPRHLEAWLRGAQTLADHPWGLGPGRAGEVSVRVLGANGIVTESSYLQFGVEYGIVGMGLLTGFVLSMGRALLAAAVAGRAGAAGVGAAWCALALAACFLHALTERPAAYPVMILAGISLAPPLGRGRLATAAAPRAGVTS
ncbi:MAG: O-antigen ligase family protein [bacterium]